MANSWKGSIATVNHISHPSKISRLRPGAEISFQGQRWGMPWEQNFAVESLSFDTSHFNGRIMLRLKAGYGCCNFQDGGSMFRPGMRVDISNSSDQFIVSYKLALEKAVVNSEGSLASLHIQDVTPRGKIFAAGDVVRITGLEKQKSKVRHSLEDVKLVRGGHLTPSSQRVTTIVGQSDIHAARDGLREVSSFNHPSSICTTNISGKGFLAEPASFSIRMFDSQTGLTRTIAGDGVRGNEDGNFDVRNHAEMVARFDEPVAVAIAHDESFLIVADRAGHLRHVNLEGATMDHAFATVATYAASKELIAPSAIAFSPSSDEYAFILDGHALLNVSLRSFAPPKDIVAQNYGSSYCSATHRCARGFGQCREDNHCQPGLICATWPNTPGVVMQNNFPRQIGICSWSAETITAMRSFWHTQRHQTFVEDMVTLIAGSATHNGHKNGYGSVARFFFPHRCCRSPFGKVCNHL